MSNWLSLIGGGCIGVGRVVSQREGGAGERVPFVAGERHGAHAVLLFADEVEPVEHVERTVDDVLHDIAFVGHTTRFSKYFGGDNAVGQEGPTPWCSLQIDRQILPKCLSVA
jgi:hypothetical protein